ncbi:MAG: BrnT family toxin [Acidobacteria bacterium]|nr:BrnT family toxin [Acidobacteriota bacterium]
MAGLVYSFDSRKASANLRKHGISFDEATEVFLDPNARTLPDHDHSDEEDRFVTLGMSKKRRILFVVHTEFVENQLRIISARKATRQERKQYEEAEL